jgi:hypothetical protein
MKGFDGGRSSLSQKYCDSVKIVLDNSQNFSIISHILKHEEPSGHALVIYKVIENCG